MPLPPAASAPALQWVRIPIPSASREEPCSPILSQSPMSSWRIVSASFRSSFFNSATPVVFCSSRCFRQRFNAQERLTAVGREELRQEACFRNWFRNSPASSVRICHPEAASASPAAHPIAGAPRTASVLIASQASSMLSMHR